VSAIVLGRLRDLFLTAAGPARRVAERALPATLGARPSGLLSTTAEAHAGPAAAS
jgi:hypothetical protein